jgi:hypothetical protein
MSLQRPTNLIESRADRPERLILRQFYTILGRRSLGKDATVTEPNKQERRRSGRLSISYYLPVLDSSTEQVMGHLVDISSTGLMIDCKEPIPTGLDFSLRLDLVGNLAEKPFLEFSARSKWCRADPIQPFMYNAGMEITKIAPEDAEIVQRIAEKYGKRQTSP